MTVFYVILMDLIPTDGIVYKMETKYRFGNSFIEQLYLRIFIHLLYLLSGHFEKQLFVESLSILRMP